MHVNRVYCSYFPAILNTLLLFQAICRVTINNGNFLMIINQRTLTFFIDHIYE